MNNISYLPVFVIYSYVFLLGICIGSFLNVVILRSLSGESFIISRSKCPCCNNQLKWFMNIPLLSYIFLRGKCAYCKEKISPQYPFVELFSGLIFLFTFINFGFNPKTIFLFVIFSFFIVLSGTDFKESVVVDIHTYLLYIICLAYSFFGFGETTILGGFLGSIFGFLFFEILCFFSKLIIKQRMFGFGDSLMALGIGAIFGVKNFLVVALISFVIQCLSAIPVLIKKAYKQNKKKLALSYFFVFISIISLFFIKNLSQKVYFPCVLVMTLVLLYSSKNIISELKNKTKEDDFCLMPFGPALLISSTICIFYLDSIKKIIVDFLFY